MGNVEVLAGGHGSTVPALLHHGYATAVTGLIASSEQPEAARMMLCGVSAKHLQGGMGGAQPLLTFSPNNLAIEDSSVPTAASGHRGGDLAVRGENSGGKLVTAEYAAEERAHLAEMSQKLVKEVEDAQDRHRAHEEAAMAGSDDGMPQAVLLRHRNLYCA